MSFRTRMILTAVAWVVALAAAGWYFLIPHLEQKVTDTLGHGDYVLQATDGTKFTEASLKGAPSAVFFGYTHCPDVCPTTLGDIATWEDDLAKEGKTLRVFFVTVDPARDTAGILKDYVSWLPQAVGVTGSEAEIQKAIRAFRIYAQKGKVDENGDYTMNHSANVLLFDAQGRFFEPIGYQEAYNRTMDKLHRLLKR